MNGGCSFWKGRVCDNEILLSAPWNTFCRLELYLFIFPILGYQHWILIQAPGLSSSDLITLLIDEIPVHPATAPTTPSILWRSYTIVFLVNQLIKPRGPQRKGSESRPHRSLWGERLSSGSHPFKETETVLSGDLKPDAIRAASLEKAAWPIDKGETKKEAWFSIKIKSQPLEHKWIASFCSFSKAAHMKILPIPDTSSTRSSWNLPRSTGKF